MGVCKYGPDVLFVHQDDVFFGLAECYVGECSKDIEAGFCLSVYVVYMLAMSMKYIPGLETQATIVKIFAYHKHPRLSQTSLFVTNFLAY